MLRAHLHLHVALTDWKNGRRLGALKKSVLSEVGKNWIEKYFFYLVFDSLTLQTLSKKVLSYPILTNFRKSTFF